MSGRFLAGTRVVDLGGEPLAFAGKILAGLGAGVILVEPPGGGPGRRVAPLLRAADGTQVSPYFCYTAAGKRSVTSDIATPGGLSLVRRLVDTADVLLVSDDDETLAARGLDERTLRAPNPRLVVTSLTPFGRNGPRRRWKGSDLVAWAASGALGRVGDPDRPPLAPGGRLAYAAGSLQAVAGTMLALRARERIGRGQTVDVSLQEAILSMTATGGPHFALENLGAPLNRRGQQRSAGMGMFDTKDGMVDLLPYMPGQWDALAEWIRDDLGIEEATLDVFSGSSMVRVPYVDLIEGWVKELATRYTKQDFLVEAQRRGIPSGAVNEPTDLLSDPHLDAVDGWSTAEVPDVGPLRIPRLPLRVDGVSMPTGPVPAPGEANDEIWGGLLGMSEDELAALRAEGSI